MLTNLVWWTGIALELALITRGTLAGLFGTYPLFYAYIASVLIKDLLALVCYTLAPTMYAAVYWPTELATIVASFGVLIEIFRRSVRHSPGLVRFSQGFLLMAFGLTTVYVSAGVAQRESTSIYHAIAELGRDLRLLEGALLIVVLWLFARYRIALGRNLIGMVIGYSFWVGVNLTDLAFLYSRGNEASVLLRALVPASYTITLAVWLATLWSVQPEPLLRANQLEHDYEFFAGKTRALLAKTSHSVGRAIKP
jgi:hypothetical protein